MQTLLDWLDTIGVGAILLALVAWFVSRRKTKAESGKLDADAAQTIANTAISLVAPLSTQVGALTQQVATQGERIGALEADARRKDGLLDSAGVVIRDFLSCGVPDCPIVAKSHTIPADLGIEVHRG